MYNLQATLREITVLDLPVTEITVEVVDLPLYLDMTAKEITVEVVDLFPVEEPSIDFPDLEVEDQLPPPPEVVYVPWDDFPDPSPAQLGLHIDNSILHA